MERSKLYPTGKTEPAKAQVAFATLDDVENLATLHLKCFSNKDHIAVLFGEEFIRAAYKWFITDPQTFVLVAKFGTNLVGFTALADKPYNGPMLRACKWEAFRGVLRRPYLIVHPELLIRVFRMIFPSEKLNLGEKVAHIAFTGVEPELQGKGIGKVLKQESIRICKERGMTAIITGVRKDNFRAQAMNESVGFVEVPELQTRRFVYLKLEL